MSSFDYVFFGGPPSASKKKKPKKKHNKTYNNWFESLAVPQLKQLCKAAKLPVSGTKSLLCERLMSDSAVYPLGTKPQYDLKICLKDSMLVQSGNKFEQVLRLVNHMKGTGQVKRAATEVVIDEETGQEVQVLKKRKVNPKPETIYNRIEKKIKAVSQNKYQSQYGSKRHAPDVFNMLDQLITEFCIDTKIVQKDPVLAFNVAKAGFQSLYDHWQIMERPGYAGYASTSAFKNLECVLKQVGQRLSPGQIEDMVVLLENINRSLNGFCINLESTYDRTNGTRVEYNKIERAIRVIMPNYDKDTRNTDPKYKPLNSEINIFASSIIRKNFT